MRTRVLSDEEIRALITGFDPTRWSRALRLLFLTGLRRDEVFGLKWSWIDLEKGVLTLPPEAEKTGRVRDELRRAALPPLAVTLLAEQRAALFAGSIRSEFVFATSTGERPHPDSLSRSSIACAVADPTAFRRRRISGPSSATQCCPTR